MRTYTIPAVFLGGLTFFLGLGGCAKRPDPAPDVAPGFIIHDAATVDEGNSGTKALTFPVTLSPAPSSTVSVGYRVSTSSTATSGDDFETPTNFTVNFAAGSVAESITINVKGDALYENDEAVTITLENPAGADIVTASATGTIRNDDPKPTVSLQMDPAGLSVCGNSYCIDEAPDPVSGAKTIGFKVRLDAPSGLPTTVGLNAGGSAVFLGDYVVLDKDGVRDDFSSNLVLAAGETERSYTLEIVDDGDAETAENVALMLTSSVQNAKVGSSDVNFTINANDALVYNRARLRTLNDSGVIRFADTYGNSATSAPGDMPGQDAATGADAGGTQGFRYIKLDANGQALPDAAIYTTTPWSCVKDNVTGLIWEVKTATQDGLLAQSRKVSWYSGDVTNNGGDAGSAGDTQCAANQYSHCSTAYYVGELNRMALCGMTGWRLPTVEELRGLGDYGRDWQRTDISGTNATAQVYFPNTYPALSYWSSTPAASASQALAVSFYNLPAELAEDKTKWLGIRLVNDGYTDQPAQVSYAQNVCSNIEVAAVKATTPDGRFLPLATDSPAVLDTHTGLVWSRCPVGSTWNAAGPTCQDDAGVADTYDWSGALTATASLSTYLGSSGWRLPNVKELSSIVERHCLNPAINKYAFADATGGDFWTNSPIPQLQQPSAQNKNYIEKRVWTVNFTTGQSVQNDRTVSAHLRLVRDATTAELDALLPASP